MDPSRISSLQAISGVDSVQTVGNGFQCYLVLGANLGTVQRVMERISELIPEADLYFTVSESRGLIVGQVR